VAHAFEQCEKDGKAYVEGVRGSEQGFEHLNKHEESDMVISQAAKTT